MPTYVYETIPPAGSSSRPRRFEVKQSMHEAPLTSDPVSGEPVRRVISGGYGFITEKAAPPPQPCGGQCACHGLN
jgi:predicted nucleic acid-binding Zn ribbon protein